MKDVGSRLQAYRLDRGLSPEELAGQLGISRAALYRAEKGEIFKIELLIRITHVLGVSLQSLLGIGMEYVDGAVAFFTRMAQLEMESDQIICFFGPISYLLTSDSYDAMLESVFEDFRDDDGETRQAVGQLKTVLKGRKQAYQRRRPLLVNLVSASDLERFLAQGMLGRRDLPEETRKQRRLMARREAQYIAELVRSQPIGVQIGILPETTPSSGFQLFRQPDRTVLAMSPYRLGEQPNIRTGVGLITEAPEGVQLHENISLQMWNRALKGEQAAQFIDELIDRFGI